LPTDTVYGLAADPWHEEAMARLHDLKDGPAGGAIGLLVASVDHAAGIVALGVGAWALAAAHWPGALTLIARAARPLPEWVGDRGRTVGVRMPDSDLVLDLLSEAGPLAVTSADRLGEAPVASDEDARARFGDSVGLYLPGTCPEVSVSTVVDVTGTRVIVLRQGSVVLG
jgi:tRNA threonylcarbamoyl adenosine modification protein (Sua5/YciO/YrdC/YwlC family)